MGAPMRMSDVDVDAGKTPHPDADKGKIPESEWLPMIPFDVAVWGDADPLYDPPFGEAQLRVLVRSSRKRHGLPPLTNAEMDELVADGARMDVRRRR